MKKKNHWQKNIYSKKLQLNIFPFPEIISYFKNLKFKNRSKIKILEIGCGCGNNISFLAEQGFKVCGVDISSSAILFAKKIFKKKKLKAVLKVGDIKDIDWPSNTFDYIIDRSTLTHNTYDDIDLILKEARRVLKKNGLFLSYDLFGLNIPDLKFGKKIQKNTFISFKKGYFKLLGLTSFFNFNELKKLFKNFKILKIQRKVLKNDKNKIEHEVFNLVAKKK